MFALQEHSQPIGSEQEGRSQKQFNQDQTPLAHLGRGRRALTSLTSASVEDVVYDSQTIAMTSAAFRQPNIARAIIGARPNSHKPRRILIAGSGKIAVSVAQNLLLRCPGVVVAGAADSMPQNQLKHAFPDMAVLGELNNLREVLIRHCIDELHVALPITICSTWIEPIRRASTDVGVPVVLHLDLPKFPASDTVRISSCGLTVSSGVHPSTRGLSRISKRVFDLVVASAAVLALSPLYLLIAAAIKLTSPGPVFFRQERVGRCQRVFGMLKFRSMVADAETLRSEVAGMNNARGISFKIFNDPRVTKIGAILRRTSLDELPQLFNVITNDMSLVGPRPIPVWVADQLNEARYYRRFSVQPGLTGLWQVEGRQQDFDWMATQDLRYVDNWSLALDAWILLLTVPAVFRGEGAH